MGLLDILSKGMIELEKFANSKTGQEIIARAEQKKVNEMHRTTGLNGLRCSIDRLVNNGAAIYCEGNVKNTGKSTYKRVIVTVEFKNDADNIVDRKKSYVITFGDMLYPGDSVPFRELSTAKKIHSAQVFVSEYEEC